MAIKKNSNPELKTKQDELKYQKHPNKSFENAKYFFVKLTRISFVVFIVLNILGPLVIYTWPGLMSHMIFQHFIHIPFKNLSNPADFGLNDTYAFSLDHDNVKLGAWHILPDNQKLIESDHSDEHFKINIPKHPDRKTIVILYLHGNTNDRSTGHRLYLYSKLRSYGYHIVAVDYRGYGDSTGEPTEKDVVKDSLFTYEYIQKNVPWATIYLWGHSLGTGILSRVARILTQQNRPAVGVVLESPFYNIVEEVELHPFTLLWPYNPIFYRFIEDALKSLDIQFRSDIHLTKVKSKIMIMHAEDDLVIPMYQGEKLYEVASKNGISDNITFHRISSIYGCGHRNIYYAPNFTELVVSFIV